VLRELEYAARTQKAAASRERARQPARQDTPETREAAERIGAQLIEQEEREQAAQAKVRVAPPSPQVELHSVQLGVDDAAFLSHG
jgi:seryl-tRNA synthetase